MKLIGKSYENTTEKQEILEKLEKEHGKLNNIVPNSNILPGDTYLVDNADTYNDESLRNLLTIAANVKVVFIYSKNNIENNVLLSMIECLGGEMNYINTEPVC